jgi:diaminohydroxyphosphoribosylaminopyrimidine deaminase / 5-amino-6-(5-phosphoribosylamino)uracil reductase
LSLYRDELMIQHDQFMLQAVSLAKRGLYSAHPNPSVGCVIVHEGVIVAQGWHERAGEPHAEINAINQALDQNIDLSQCVLYVTLEPCSHHGRTGPCCQAIVEAGIKHVVMGMMDPNPLVQGQGVEYLKQHGVSVVENIQTAEVERLNPGFITRMKTSLPRVQLKVASSLDGRTAMMNGESKWITDHVAREDVQRYRAKAGAIITGSGTFYVDNPSLTVRAHTWTVDPISNSTDTPFRQPLRVIVSSSPPKKEAESSIIFNDDIRTVWMCNRDEACKQHAYPKHIDVIGVGVKEGKIDLREVLQVLSDRYHIHTVWVEAGAVLSGAFITEGLVDEIIVYMAPCFLGSFAKPMFELPIMSMNKKVNFKINSVRHVGETVRITLQIK